MGYQERWELSNQLHRVKALVHPGHRNIEQLNLDGMDEDAREAMNDTDHILEMALIRLDKIIERFPVDGVEATKGTG